MGKSPEYIDSLQIRGISSFSTDEFAAGAKISRPAAKAALHRLRKKGLIATPYREFHVIVPHAYKAFGCLPAEEFIDDLMKHLGVPYYVGLLSAAQYHGAAHQSPQIFQVLVKKRIASLECGRIRVSFTNRIDLEKIPTMLRNVRTGYLRVATLEATALDVVGYADQCAGLDNVATVLSELHEKLDPSKLKDTASIYPLPWAQRLGYLLDSVGASEKTVKLAQFVSKSAKRATPLNPHRGMTGAVANKKWKVAINATVEPDEV